MSDDLNSQILSFLAARFDRIERRFDATDAKIERLSSRMTIVERAVQNLRREMIDNDAVEVTNSSEIERLADRVSRIELDLATKNGAGN